MNKSSKEYILEQPLGIRSKVEISIEDFQKIGTAKSIISDTISFEENVMLIMNSSKEYEEFILKSALDFYYYPTAEFDFYQDSRMNANLKLLNYLNSITSFRDRFPEFRSCKTGNKLQIEFKRMWNEQQDTCVSFRFCGRLRNYAQHQTQPVWSVTAGGGWNENPRLMETHVSVFVKVDDICKHRSIKTDEKKNYNNNFGELADISLIIRETNSSVGFIVNDMRKMLNEDFLDSENCIKYQLSKLGIGPENLKLANALEIDNGTITKSISLFYEFINRANRLRNTRIPTNFQNHYISNRYRGHS